MVTRHTHVEEWASLLEETVPEEAGDCPSGEQSS